MSMGRWQIPHSGGTPVRRVSRSRRARSRRVRRCHEYSFLVLRPVAMWTGYGSTARWRTFTAPGYSGVGAVVSTAPRLTGGSTAPRLTPTAHWWFRGSLVVPRLTHGGVPETSAHPPPHRPCSSPPIEFFLYRGNTPTTPTRQTLRRGYVSPGQAVRGFGGYPILRIQIAEPLPAKCAYLLTWCYPEAAEGLAGLAGSWRVVGGFGLPAKVGVPVDLGLSGGGGGFGGFGGFRGYPVRQGLPRALSDPSAGPSGPLWRPGGGGSGGVAGFRAGVTTTYGHAGPGPPGETPVIIHHIQCLTTRE
jgi:hypothetical protein